MLGLVLVPVALLLAGRAAAQSLPDCTRRCITVSATPGCDINTLSCMCTTASMRTAIPKCINAICGGGGGAAGAIDAWNTRCAALADNSDTTVPPPPNTPKPTPSPQDPPSTRTPASPSSTETPPAHSSVPDKQTPSPDPTGTNSSGTSSPSASSPSPSSDPTSPIGASSSNDNGNNSSNGGGGPSSGGLIGAIVGGLLGGLLVVGIIGCFLWRRRQGDDRLQAYGVSAMSSTSGLSGQPMRMSSTHKHSESLQSGAHVQLDLQRDNHSPYQDVPGPASIPDSLAPRPLVLDTAPASFPRRKGDPPPPPSFRGPASPETEIVSSATSQSYGYGYRDEVSPQGSTPPMVFPAGLTPAQLDLVQTMINRGLQGTAVVDVIERMLAENSTPAPQYDDDASRPRT